MVKHPDNKDFEEFSKASRPGPKAALSQAILERVRSDLEPSVSLVFTKLLLVQSIVGVMTMLFCPQFNLSLTNNYDLFHFFHRNFGQTICMAICGGIFVGSGAVIGSFLLRKTEMNQVAKRPLLYYFALASVFLSAFMLLGVDVYLEAALAWVAGSWLIGCGVYLTSRSLRLLLRSLLV
jgi:uncharacterized protein YneF (UPF0154 family)